MGGGLFKAGARRVPVHLLGLVQRAILTPSGSQTMRPSSKAISSRLTPGASPVEAVNTPVAPPGHSR